MKKGFTIILAIALFFGAAFAHHVSEYENLPGWGRFYNVINPSATAEAITGLRNLFAVSGNLGLVNLIATQSTNAQQFSLFMVFESQTAWNNNQAAVFAYLDSTTFTNAYNTTDVVFTGTVGEHEDEDDITKAAGQYNVMTIYNVVNANNLNNVIEDRFEDEIDDENGFIEFIGMPFNNNAQYFTSVTFTNQGTYDAAIVKVNTALFTDVITRANQEVAGTVQDTYHFDHHEDGTSDASKLGALSFIVASAAYLLM